MKLKKGNHKPSAFNRCVGNTLLDTTYKNKKQWQNEFKKAVKHCKSNPTSTNPHQLISRGKIDLSRHKSPTMLMTKEMERTIPPLYSTEKKKPEDVTVHAHYFTPFSNWDWYITEYDGKDIMFGLVKGHEVELGYISLLELKKQGANVERDLYWSKKSLSKVMKETGYRTDQSKKGETKDDLYHFSTWKQEGTWHYDIRKDDPLRGKVVSSGSGYKSEKEANKALDDTIKIKAQYISKKNQNF